MNVKQLKNLIRPLSTIRPNNYILKVNKRDRSTLSSSDLILDLTEFVNKYSLIKDGTYVLTTYDSAKLSDSCRGVLGRLDQPHYDDFQDIDRFDFRYSLTNKCLQMYIYDSITFNVNKIDSIELYSTKSTLFRWFLKLIKKL